MGSTPACLLGMLCVLLGVLSVWCASAQALVGRGHVFGFSFASPGVAGGELSGPAGVAVNEATGDVYVVDRANDRIARFGTNGEFTAVWGWGVKDGKKEYEICKSGCEAGVAGDGKDQLHAPEAVAIDNSTNPSDPSRGDVYVVMDARSESAHLAKFTAQGEPLGELKQAGREPFWEGALDGVAVDGSGRLWVYRAIEAEAVIERFGDGAKNKFETSFESSVLCPKPGFAIDSSGEVLYVDHERENNVEGCPSEEDEAARPVLAATLRNTGEGLETLSGALDPLQTGALASEASSGDAYIANVGTLAAFTPDGSLIQRLALAGAQPAGSGIGVDAATEQIYVADSAASKVDVFEVEPSGKPSVSDLQARDLSPSASQLSAQIDPSGADTRYYFQYGTVDCVVSPTSCTDVPAAPGSDLGDGFGDQGVSVELRGLSPSTTYHYRLIAANANGQAEGADTFGSLTTLPSAAGVLADDRAWEMVSPPEKDGSGIEPLREEGGLIQASEDGNSITYVANGPIVSEPEGSRAPYPTQAIATRAPSQWISQQIVTPHTKGEGFIPGEAPEYRFFSPDLSAALVQPDNQALIEPLEQPPLSPEASEKTMYLRDTASGQYLPLVTAANDTAHSQFGEQLEFIDATPDLSHVVFDSEVPLVAGAGPGLYEWQAGQPLAPVSVLPDSAPALEPQLGANSHNVRGAISNDGSRVFWTGESEVGTGESGETVTHLYMRDMTSGKTIQLDATVAPIPEVGPEESEVAFQAASSDGSRVFFTDTARLTEDSNLAPVAGSTNNPADLYECEIVEEDGNPSCKLSDLTVDQNGSESAQVLDIVPAVSEDGGYVYFVANGVLAPGATPGNCVRLNTETPPPGASCNLYVWHDNAITFIASLSDEDGPDWGRSEAFIKGGGSSIEPLQDLSDVTARVSPDGRYLAFMSDRSLTGYDNVDANPAAKGAHDEEVYLYDATGKLLTCVSCNPTGQPPHGVFDTVKAGEGQGLLVDRRLDWASNPKTAAPTAHWLAGSVPGWTPLGISSPAQALRQPRYLSDSGRLFFNSADPLVQIEGARTRTELVNEEAAQVGVESVYEYEPGGVGWCERSAGCLALTSSGTAEQESAFVDASANGDHAFFVTAQPLLARDRDTNFDLYDARVCTQASPCQSEGEHALPPCASSNECRATSSPQPGVTPTGSATFSGPGNHPAAPPTGSTPTRSEPKRLTRAQKLAHALRSCRARYKQEKSKKRVACERQARKAYGAKSARTRAHKESK